MDNFYIILVADHLLFAIMVLVHIQTSMENLEVHEMVWPAGPTWAT